ncbi:uncharacterized protein LOC100168229 isoform X2 [Acyrthosiphon pisum]|uniref:SAM domain-containing protein n=1 Tax=Acyrthosiphon pisum TaxID=7029 RepID=A0A8R2JSD7_ACYPI|nr:uncharacterized protein LOC100168229 isoform X2 [Acyrthosiphon pisum]
MDKLTESTLKEWGFEQYVVRFKEAEIDFTAFLTLTENMVADLIPIIGHRSKFVNSLKQLNEKPNKESSQVTTTISATMTTNTSATTTMDNSAMMTTTNTITTATDNYTDDPPNLSTHNLDKSLTNLTSSKDIPDAAIRTNAVEDQYPQPRATTTTKPFSNTYIPGSKNTSEIGGQLSSSASENIQKKQYTSEPKPVLPPNQDKMPPQQLNVLAMKNQVQQQQQQQQQQQHQQKQAGQAVQHAVAQQQQQQAQQQAQQQQAALRIMNQQQQQNGPDRQTIWSGTLEWIENVKSLNKIPKITRNVPCIVSANIKNGELELKAETWPNKLIMQFIHKNSIGIIGVAHLKDSKSLFFQPTPCEALESLTKYMTSGYVGCVHFNSALTSHNCDVKVLILLYTHDRKAFVGFIPNDQAAFLDRLCEIKQHKKASSAILRQGQVTTTISATMTTNTSATTTMDNSAMMTTTNTITTATNNYTDDPPKLSTCNIDKSLTNLTSSKDIPDAAIRTNAVEDQYPQPRATTTTKPFFNTYIPGNKNTSEIGGQLSSSASENIQNKQYTSEPKPVLPPNQDKMPPQQLNDQCRKRPSIAVTIKLSDDSHNVATTKIGIPERNSSITFSDSSSSLWKRQRISSNSSSSKQEYDVTSSISATMTTNTSATTTKTNTITTATDNYTDEPPKPSTSNLDKSLINLDLKRRKRSSNTVPSEISDHSHDVTTTSSTLDRNSSTTTSSSYSERDDVDDDDYDLNVPLSKTTLMLMSETEIPGDCRKMNYFSFATQGIKLESESSSILFWYENTKAQFAAMDLNNPLNQRFKPQQYKHFVSIPNHSKFCEDQLLKNENSYVSNDKVPEIKAPIGMLNLYQIIQKFEHEHNCEFIFLPSSIGKDLIYYTENADLGLDPSHTVSNNVMDVLRYPLRYGLIPAIYGIDLEMFLASVFLKYKFDSESTRRLKTKTLEGKVTFKFIEGEIEALVFDYWSRSTVDLINYDESVSRPDLKDLLQYLFRKLYGTTTVVQKNEVAFFLWNLRKFAKFDLSKDIISTNCLYFLKTHISTVWPEISHNDMILWSIFFNEMNVHHLLREHTISTMFKTLDHRFEFIMSKAAQVRALRRKPFPDVNLWRCLYTAFVSKKYHYFAKKYVICVLSSFFKSHIDVDSQLCIAIDNFYYYHIFLLSRYSILHNIDIETRILTSTAVQGFLDKQRDPSLQKYCQSYGISHPSKRMRSKMVSCFRRLYIRDSDKFEAEFKITKFDESLYQSLNELICDRMICTLSTVIDREGRFSPKGYAKLHPRQVVDSEGSPPPNRLCCYAFARSLYALMYGLNKRESVSMKCVELNCNFKHDDKDYYKSLNQTTSLKTNYLKKKKNT